MSGTLLTSKSFSVGLVKFNGGLNSTASGLSISDSEATDLQNIDFDVFGSIKKRNGYATLNSSAFNSGATCVGLHWYEKSDATTKLFGVFGNKVARMDDLDGTWDNITGAITVTAGNNNLVSSTTFLDTALFTNNVDVPFQATDSGNAAASTVPTGLTKAKWVTNWNNYAFYANVTVSGTAHPTRIYWSNLKTISTWTATDFVDVSQNDGQPIEGVVPLGDRLIILKTKSIWFASFTGDSDVPFVFTQTQSHVGCISGYSAQKVNNGIIFLSYDGFYFFDGNNSFKISDKIDSTLRGYATNRFAQAVSAWQGFKNRYWCSFSTSGGSTHNRVLTYDAVNNAWSIYTGYTPNAFAVVITSGDERIYWGDYAGFAYRGDNGANDNPAGTSTAINAFYKTKWFSLEDLVSKKGPAELIVYYQISSSTLSLGYSFDFESADQYSQTFYIGTSADTYGSGLYGTATYAASGGSTIRRAIAGRGRVFRISFTNATISESFQIDGIGLYPHLETVA